MLFWLPSFSSFCILLTIAAQCPFTSIDCKHKLHVDIATWRRLNLVALILSWILPPSILLKHFGKKAYQDQLVHEKSPLTVVSMPKCMGFAPLVENIGVRAEVVNISRERMQKSANLFISNFFETDYHENLPWKDTRQYTQPTASVEVKNLK